MNRLTSPQPQPSPTLSAARSIEPGPDWIARWQQVARRIRVPLGFFAAGLYLLDLWRHRPQPAAIAWSMALVLPGLWLRGYASGYVNKNRELTTTGPYAYTRNPLYLGSMLMAAGFALALLSWPVAVVLAVGFLIIYVPVIAGEERFLSATFVGYEEYCGRVPRLIPRLIPRRQSQGSKTGFEGVSEPKPTPESIRGGFSLERYLQHREYNAGIGVILLYLGLLFIGPALDLLWSGTR